MSTSIDELSTSTGTKGGFVCLVDGDGQYNTNEKKMIDLINHVDPTGNEDYSIVGIMGCQSTGKSTLLNRLFATDFKMMDAEYGRSQTTKGIWLDAARNTNSLVVMDLEGSDSGERGEDRTSFERQTLLFAMALCEILIINMLETDIGRYTASNFGILKTVFEVQLELQLGGKTQQEVANSTKGPAKTMLLFLVRDHIEEGTPFSALQGRLLREVSQLWDEIVSSHHSGKHHGAQLLDYFDLRFTYLPHYVYCRDRFDILAENLKQRFIAPIDTTLPLSPAESDPTLDTSHSTTSFLHTSYHGAKSVPAESFPHYAQQLWSTIKDNKDISIPTQQEMLSIYRCDEAIAHLFARFQMELPSRDKPIEALDIINTLVQSIFTEYKQQTSRYQPNVVATKLRELQDKLYDVTLDYITSAIESRHHSLIDAFMHDISDQCDIVMNTKYILDAQQNALDDNISILLSQQQQQQQQNSNNISISSLSSYTQSIAEIGKQLEPLLLNPDILNNLYTLQLNTENTLDAYIKQLSSHILPLFSDTHRQSFSKHAHVHAMALKNKLQSLIRTENVNQIVNIYNSAITQYQYIIFDKAQVLLSTPNEILWSKLGELVTSSLYAIHSILRPYYTKWSIIPDQPTLILLQKRICDAVQGGLYQLASDHAAQVSTIMRDIFESEFVYTSTDTLRVWGPRDDPATIYDKARTKACVALLVLAKYQLRGHLGLNNDIASYMTTPLSVYIPPVVANAPLGSQIVMALDQCDDYTQLSNQAMTRPDLISKEQLLLIEKTFDHTIGSSLSQALIDVERAKASRSQISPWVVLLLIIFGYDELLFVLTNPPFLFFLLLLGTSAIVIYKLGLTPLVKGVVRRIIDQISVKIQDLMTPQLPASTTGHQSVSSSSSTTVGTSTNSTTSSSSSSDTKSQSHDNNISAQSGLSSLDVTHPSSSSSSSVASPRNTLRNNETSSMAPISTSSSQPEAPSGPAARLQLRQYGSLKRPPKANMATLRRPLQPHNMGGSE